MNKKLIFAFALAVVLISGAFAGAQAECLSGCLPHISMPSCFFGACNNVQARDYDRPDLTCQGAYRVGPTTPEPMGSPGF